MEPESGIAHLRSPGGRYLASAFRALERFLPAFLACLLAAPAVGVAAEAPPFVYCDRTVVEPHKDDLRVAAMGDLVFSENDAINRETFQDFIGLLKSADFVFGNLEGAITDYNVSTKRYVPGRVYAFRFPPETAALLRKANFHALSIANNHSGDYGQIGFSDTVRHLAQEGIAATGLKGSSFIQTVKGLRVGLVAFSHYPRFNNINDLAESARLVAEVRSRADVVIVTNQGGAEGGGAALLPGGPEMFLGEERGDVRAFAQAVVRAGADAVIGHGPHVLRAAECIDGKPVLYSIGNFVSAGGLSTRGMANVSVFAEVLFGPRGAFKAVRVVPATFSVARLPVRDPTGRGLHLINLLSERAARLPEFRGLRFLGFEDQHGSFMSWLSTTEFR